MQEHEQNTENRFSRFLGFWTEERSLTVMLLLLVLHIFILTPVRFLSHVSYFISILFLCLALLVGLLTMVRLKAVRWIGVIAVAGAILFKFAGHAAEAPWLSVGDMLFTLFSLSMLVYIVFLQVSRHGPVTAHTIRGAISLYLLIAMLFALLYSLAEKVAPGAFIMPSGSSGTTSGGEEFYYFSIVTMTTVGFGDITAVHPLVRSLVMLEALIGQLYPAILIARLVTLEIETRRGGK